MWQYIQYIANIVLLPPGCFTLAFFLGVLLIFRYRRIGIAILVLTTFMYYLLSTAFVSAWMANSLQLPPLSITKAVKSRAQAIVVLEGGRYDNAPEYHQQTMPSAYTLARLQYAAYLYRQMHLPILVSGGDKFNQKVRDENFMAKSLNNDFRVPVRWVETKSEDTYQNAQYSARILKSAHVHAVILVTDAVHMKRALWTFQQAGLEAIPASTRYIGELKNGSKKWMNWVPYSGHGSSYCLHEYLGLAFYKAREAMLAHEDSGG